MEISRPVALAEMIGTAGLLVLVVGSGYAVESLGAAPATQLFIHAVVVGVGLAVLIAVFMPVSGSQFNPIVTMALFRRGELDRRSALELTLVQMLGALAGVAVANVMFSESLGSVSGSVRSGVGVWLGEIVASFGLVLVILLLAESGRRSVIAPAVGGWVMAMIVGSASTGFANPAVAVSRMFTDSYTGIAPSSVPLFVAAQLVGAIAAVVVCGSVLRSSEVSNV